MEADTGQPPSLQLVQLSAQAALAAPVTAVRVDDHDGYDDDEGAHEHDGNDRLPAAVGGGGRVPHGRRGRGGGQLGRPGRPLA